MSVVKRLRARAAQLRAMAADVDADADDIEREIGNGADQLVPVDDLPFKRPLVEAARLGKVEIFGPRGARVIRRRDLDAWLATKRVKLGAPRAARPSTNSAYADTFARSAARLAGGAT